MTELEKMMSGKLYEASDNKELLDLLAVTSEKCYDYNQLRPHQAEERKALLKQILGKTGERFKIIPPFFCDYGFNIEVGEDFFANTNLVILDEAKVTFGDHVFIAPNCAFYTAGHPLDVQQRNDGLQYSLPITVGNNVWICVRDARRDHRRQRCDSRWQRGGARHSQRCACSGQSLPRDSPHHPRRPAQIPTLTSITPLS